MAGQSTYDEVQMANANETYIETIAMDGLIPETGNQEIIIDGMPVQIPSGNFRTEVLDDGTVQVVVYHDSLHPAENQMIESSIQTDIDFGNKRVHHVGIQNTTVPQFNSYDFSEVEVQTDPTVESSDRIKIISSKDTAQIEELKKKKGVKIVQIKGAKIIQNIMNEKASSELKGFRAGKEVMFHKCGVCGKVYKNKTNWQNHLKIHAKEKVYMCGFCGQIFQKALFATHIKTHQDEEAQNKVKNENQNAIKLKAENSESEDKTDADKQYLVRSHQVTLPNQQVATVIDLGNLIDVAMNAEVESGNVPATPVSTSTEIGTSTAAEESENLEMQNNGPQDDIPNGNADTEMENEDENSKTKYIYKCNVCGKEYNNKSNCQRHLKIHTHEKLYKCKDCGKTYMHRYELNMHSRIHTGEKPFKCPICTRAFNESGNLRRHMKIHTGDDTPYKCGVCFKGFGDMYRLHVHLKVHSGNINCDTCGKKFGKISDLYRHIRIHTGDKPYKCDLCSKAFCQKVNLRTHYRTHTGQTPYRCEICNFGFSRKNILENHMRRHEEDEEEESADNPVIVKQETADTEMDTDLADVNAALDMIGKGQDEVVEVSEVENVDAKTGLIEVPSDAQEVETGLSQEEIAQLVAATVVTE